MARKVTIFTGQFGDLKSDELFQKMSECGFDGLELACGTDHFDVRKCLNEEVRARLLGDLEPLRRTRRFGRNGRTHVGGHSGISSQLRPFEGLGKLRGRDETDGSRGGEVWRQGRQRLHRLLDLEVLL